MSSSKLAIPLNPMLYFFISCVPFILLSQSFTHRALQLCEALIKLFSICFCGELSTLIVSFFGNNRAFTQLGFRNLLRKAPPLPVSLRSFKNMTLRSPRVETVDERARASEREREREFFVSLLDLPELTLDLIFERLSPAGLRSMAGVCASLRERCGDDRLWERHLRHKWGPVIGESAYQQWRCELASKNGFGANGRSSHDNTRRGLVESLLASRPFSWFFVKQKSSEPRAKLREDSLMAWYLSLESGKVWFPAQVFNRENGHVGFMLSCYDAQLCYDSSTDTFEARYSPHGRRTIEENIKWDRLRRPPVDTPPYVLHVSDCLQDLKPGDHIEIQWRRNKEFPYGWWCGLVGHLETCDGNENLCCCQYSDTIVLEFKQYNPGSRWRRTMVNRKDHREEGNEVDGFYGGLRKVSEDEISQWSQFWPKQALEQ